MATVDGGEGAAVKPGRGPVGVPGAGESDAAGGASIDAASLHDDAQGAADGAQGDARPVDGPGARLDTAAGKLDGALAAADAAGGVDAQAPDVLPGFCSKGAQCDLIEADYLTALAKAKTCNTQLAKQCQEQTAAALPCGCPVSVNSTLETEAVRKRWVDTGCPRCYAACNTRLILCRALTSPACAADRLTAAAPIGDIAIPLPTPGTCIAGAVVLQ